MITKYYIFQKKQQISALLISILIQYTLFLFLLISKMGPTYSFDSFTNPSCSSQTCSEGCCNYFGTCLNYSSWDWRYNQCWYYYQTYYNENQTNVGAIVGGVIGAIVFLVIISIAYRIYKRKKMLQMQIDNGFTGGFENSNGMGSMTMNRMNGLNGMSQMNQLNGMQANFYPNRFGALTAPNMGTIPYGQPYPLVNTYPQGNTYGQPMYYQNPVCSNMNSPIIITNMG